MKCKWNSFCCFKSTPDLKMLIEHELEVISFHLMRLKFWFTGYRNYDDLNLPKKFSKNYYGRIRRHDTDTVWYYWHRQAIWLYRKVIQNISILRKISFSSKFLFGYLRHSLNNFHCLTRKKSSSMITLVAITLFF